MSWFFLAFFAPILWAIVTLIDTYFVHSIYEDEFDGAIISGLFQSVPWLFVLLGVIDFVPLAGMQTVLAMSAGALFLLSFSCYFKALFVSNDGTLMQILWSLSVPLVPFIAWLLMGETLLPLHYVGIGLAFCGVVLFSLKVNGRVIVENFSSVAIIMLGAVVLLSLSMVVSKQVYDLHPQDFWSVFLLFSSGATGAALALLAIDKRKVRERMGKIAGLSGKYFFIFFLAEGLSVTGSLASQRAISLAPSVSFVATIESLVPVFVMLFGLILVLFFKRMGQKSIEQAYRNQLRHLPIKMLAVTMIASGIYLIS